MTIMKLFATLESCAKQTPHAPVLIGDRQIWRSAELLEAIDQLSKRLVQIRAIAVLADNGPAWVMADLAALRAGIPHIPLPGFFSPEQMAYVLDHAGVDTVLTDQPERIGELDAGFSITGQWNGLIWMRRPLTTEKDAAQLPAGTVKVSFTSGSTGNPKGVCLSAEGLLDTAEAVASRLADLPIERHLVTLPLALLLENSAGIYTPLLRGAEIHLPRLQTLGWKGMAGFDPAALQKTVETIQPDSVILVPELLKAWSLFLANTGQRAPARLTFVAVGGARIDAEAIAMARSLGLPVYQGYGLTECGSVVSLNLPGDDGDDVGRPLDHVGVRSIDGEIVIQSRAFLGYIGVDTGTEECGFATGDLGHLDANGHLHLSGRRKNLLITSYGRNIAPEWIEAVLLAQPAILQAVVSGDARPWLSAVVVPALGANAATMAAAIAKTNATLPDYARIGHWIIAQAPFAMQNGMATSNGRPLRTAILTHYANTLAAGYVTTTPEQYLTKETADVLL